MNKLLDWLNNKLEMTVCVILMSGMSIIIFIQVIARYVFNNSLSWSEELARYMFIWLVYIGISLGCKEMKHLRIDAFIKIFPKKARPWVLVFSDFLFLAFAIYITYTGIHYTVMIFNQGDYSPACHIPMWIIDMAPAVGFGLSCIREIQTIIYRIKKIKAGEGIE